MLTQLNQLGSLEWEYVHEFLKPLWPLVILEEWFAHVFIFHPTLHFYALRGFQLKVGVGVEKYLEVAVPAWLKQADNLHFQGALVLGLNEAIKVARTRLDQHERINFLTSSQDDFAWAIQMTFKIG